jgi:hypothetical protein
MGEEMVSDSDSNDFVLHIGTELIIRFGFFSELGLVLPVSIIGIGMGSRFRFSGLSMSLDVDELVYIYCS